MAKENDLFAPPSEEELSSEDMFAPPTQDEAAMFAAPTADELGTEAPEAQSSLPTEVKAIGGGLAGGAAGYGASKLGSYVADKADNLLTKVGDLSSEQVAHIRSNPIEYKKAAPLSDLLNQYRDLAQNTRQSSFDLAEQAKNALRGTENIPVKEYYSTLGKVAENPKYSSDVAPGVKESLRQSEMDKVRSQIQEQALNDQNLTQKLQDIEARQFDDVYSPEIQKLEQSLQETPGYNVPFEAREKERNVKQDRRNQRLDEKIAKTEEKLANSPESKRLQESLENAQKRKEDFQLGRSVQEERIGTVQLNKDQEKLQQLQQQLEELKAQKQAEELKFQAKRQAEIDRIQDAKSKIHRVVEGKTKGAMSKADEAFNRNVLRTPEEIIATNPDFFNVKTFDPELAPVLDKAVSKGRFVESLSPERLAEGILPALRDSANFDSTGATFGDKFNTDLSEGLRKYLGQKYPDFDTHSKASSEAIKTGEKFEKTGIKYEDQGNKTFTTEFPENKRKLLASQIASDSDKFVDEKSLIKDILADLDKQGANIPRNALGKADVDAFYNQIKSAAIKAGVAESDILKGLVDTAATTPKGVIKNTLSNSATKIQELGALGTLGKTARTVGKVLPVAGLVLGGMAGAQAAEEQGLEGIPKAAAIAGEAVNPVPFTDVAKGIAEGQKEFEQTDSIPKAAIAGVKGYTAPAVEQLEQFGTQRSNEARAAMEKRMNFKFDSEKPQQQFKQLTEYSPEALSQLAEVFGQNENRGTQAYAGPLNKAAGADDRTRSAILYGLFQQPAFRKMLGADHSTLKSKIPGVTSEEE